MPVLTPQQRRRLRIHGHAVVSADGMIADSGGDMPPGLRHDAEWQLFQAALDAAVLVVLGRLGHERHANPGRRRLVLTRAVTVDLVPDAGDPLALLWNPFALPFARVLEALHLEQGDIAVVGGTGVFDFFLPAYDVFALSEVHDCVLPGGTPCFSGGHPRLVLAASGLVPARPQMLDVAAGVTRTAWQRPA